MRIELAVLSPWCTDCDEAATSEAETTWANGSSVRFPLCAEHAAEWQAAGWTVTGPVATQARMV